MKVIDRNLLVFSTASMLFFSVFTVRNMSVIKEAASLKENAEAESIGQVKEKIDPWDLFVEAVIWRESRGNSSAIGDNGKAVGVLQIHPIMVREANRILAMKDKSKWMPSVVLLSLLPVSTTCCSTRSTSTRISSSRFLLQV